MVMVASCVLFVDNFVSLSKMVETLRLKAKQEFDCGGATCHSGQPRIGVRGRLRNPGKRAIESLLDAGSSTLRSIATAEDGSPA